jgi:hypothetical protein
MNISLFGYKINIITLLFVVVIIILVSHTFYGCHNPYALIEGADTMTDDKKNKTNSDSTSTSTSTSTSKSTSSKEGFTGANTNYGESSQYDLTMNNPVDTSSWMAPNMVVKPGEPLNPAVKAFLARPKQQLPLPEGELDFFANTRFAPEFCPNTYSNSQGCAEMSVGQYNYLITRGGNNVPYSEY